MTVSKILFLKKKKSFYSFLELQSYEQQYDSIKIENEEEIVQYYKLKKKLEQIQEQMSGMINEPKYILPFLQPGRLVTVKSGDLNFDWCVVLNFHRKPGEKVRLFNFDIFLIIRFFSQFISSMF